MEIKQLPVHDKNTLCGIFEYENDWKNNYFERLYKVILVEKMKNM